MRMINIFLCIGTLIFLSACVKEEVHTVEWFKVHEEERRAEIQKCNTYPEVLLEPNCKNAKTAHTALKDERLKEIQARKLIN